MHILSSVTDSAPFRYPDEDIVIGWGQEGGDGGKRDDKGRLCNQLRFPAVIQREEEYTYDGEGAIADSMRTLPESQ